MDSIPRIEVGRRLKAMRSDNGEEYVDASLETWLRDHGIWHQKTPIRSPQSNGVAKRMNGTLQDRARSMLVGASRGFLGGSHLDDFIHQE